jgi:hypothetical protein
MSYGDALQSRPAMIPGCHSEGRTLDSSPDTIARRPVESSLQNTRPGRGSGAQAEASARRTPSAAGGLRRWMMIACVFAIAMTSGAAWRMDQFVFATARYESGDWDSAPLVPTNIIHALAQYTAIPVAAQGVTVDLASPELFKFPFVFLTGHLPVRFSRQESDNLRAYVQRGGFIFIDDHNHDIDGAFHKTATSEINRIFGPGSLKMMPNDHEIFRSFFVFEKGPPTTSHELNGWGDNLVHEHLFGVEVNGRLGLLYSNKDYASEWGYHYQNKRFVSIDNTRFGVNVIVYALTR